MMENTQSRKTIDLSHLGGKLVLPPPASDTSGKEFDFGHLGGRRVDTPNATPGAPEAESLEPTDNGHRWEGKLTHK
jgi:hypothetical protein